ncbi:HEAT repeat domain-containing protein [Streptomyces katsurahamanus]|uniref:HEAT repeat domain-containing protein n=1 Tax=Streptomyces katsurahamanus TaxID=2577098 RepID=A0ABW9NRU6_9ACTN|nr:HEAT repeat domain-containing protein [Streptomyces katsurahamanus]MQS36030.1 hypothetical protein [Streptomyces katsurahamanus]
MLRSMDLEQLFAGLDSVRWGDVDHAYGEADDLPGIMRALAGDEQQARDALDELWSSILHQGTVYAATAEAVPFLARLVAAGVHPVELLVLLGGIAESEDEYGLPEPGACRAAVVDQLPLILPLFASGDPEVRRAAVWAAGRAGSVSVLPALRRGWRRAEEAPGVRAELLAALAHLDPEGTAATATAAVSADAPDRLRMVALLVCVDLGLPWTPAHQDAMVSLLPAGPHVVDRFDLQRNEPLHYTVHRLLLRDTDRDRSAAYDLIEAALRLPGAEARGEALWAAEHACLISRSAPGRLAGALLSLLADPSFTDTASLLPVLGKLGDRAAGAAPALAALAAMDGEPADRALEVLVRVAPEQAGPLLARDLGRRERTMRAVTGLSGLRPALPLPYGPELVNAIRIRLTEIAGSDEPRGGDAAELAVLLLGWGRQAAAALPEVTAVFQRHPARVARALAAVCPPEHRDETADLLRRAAESGDPDDRYEAADALRALTGETGPLVSVLKEVLAEGARQELPRTAGELGSDGLVLVPHLRAALTPQGDGPRSNPAMNADVQTALALWRLTGDAAEAVAVLGGVLAEAADGMWTRWPVANAARAAACIGPAGAALAPALGPLLDDPVQAPGAVIALRSLGHGPDDARAADLLLSSAERNAEWATALDALGALGPGALTPEVRARLTALAEGDLRVVDSGLEPEIVPQDERLRIRARELLAAAKD